uniref:Heterogeneous nuclear ribonucleoprotein 1 n=1 Tax=Noccaea caerulescens TaxID=107243 RepID=A0A1J3EFC7_NOCCA
MEMESCKLFIGGISWETSGDRLREYFQNYGEVLQLVIMKDRVTERVVMQKHMIDGKSLSLNISPNSKPTSQWLTISILLCCFCF